MHDLLTSACNWHCNLTLLAYITFRKYCAASNFSPQREYYSSMFYPSWTLPVPGILHYALCRPLFSLIAHLFAVFNDSRVNDKVTRWDKVRFKNRSRSQVIVRDQTYIRNTLLPVRFYRSCSIIELRRTWHNDLTISCSIFIIFDFRCNSRSNITYNNIASQVEDFSQNSLKDRRSVRVTKFYLL